MSGTGTGRQAAVAWAIRALVIFGAVSFLVMAPLHVPGRPISLGFATIDEPRIIDATIVEGLCGMLFAVSAYAVFARRNWAWGAAVAAHAVALVGVLVGIAAIAAGLGPHSTLNDVYHRLMVVLLVAGLALLATPDARAALGQGERATRFGAGGRPASAGRRPA
jgi:hypothetical protein